MDIISGFWSSPTPKVFVSNSVSSISTNVPSFCGKPALKKLVSIIPLLLCDSFKKSGASFDIAITLYLFSPVTKTSESCFFFNIINLSSCILFLSLDGKLNHILSSSALYHLSIARL